MSEWNSIISYSHMTIEGFGPRIGWSLVRGHGETRLDRDLVSSGVLVVSNSSEGQGVSYLL